MAVLSTLCVMTVITGVYSQLRVPSTSVHITIYGPKKLFLKNSSVYYPVNGDVYSEGHAKHTVNWFESPDPIRNINNPSFCSKDNTCEQGCDDNTGRCICKKGYRMDNVTGLCRDVNECMEGRTKCHPSAGCLNTRGSYICICTGDFYGDGKSCSDCYEPCGHQRYEDKPCNQALNQQKECKDCTRSCNKEFFMSSPCSERHDGDCNLCSAKCRDNQFEMTKCYGPRDRFCQEKSLLPDPESSKNVIIEDMGKTADQFKEMRFQDPSDFMGYRMFTFRRGASLFVEMTVTKVEPVHKLYPVDHSHDLSDFDRRQFRNISRLCPFPVPDFYQLQYDRVKNAVFRVTNKLEPCQTYKQFGNFPNYSNSDNKPVMCAEPGPLTSIFNLDKDLIDVKTSWAESSKRCLRRHEVCSECTRDCAQRMTLGSHDCTVVGDENDNGWSPRLQVCYNCCLKSNCTEECEHYQHRRCESERCLKGNVMVFHLLPVYIDKSKYHCHVEPEINQTLIELDYRISHHHDVLYQETIQLIGGESWTNQGMASHRGKILEIIVDSKLQSIPTFIKGDLNTLTYKSGRYNGEGETVQKAQETAAVINIRPRKPFGINSRTFGKQSCKTNITKDAVHLTRDGGVFKFNTDLMTLLEQEGHYLVTNKSVSPFISIKLPADQPLLSSMFDAASLKRNTLKGIIVHTPTIWVVEINGEISQCPGLLKINISDADYFPRTIFNVNALVRCPENFSLTFYIPTDDKPDTERKFIASVTDNKTTHHINLHYGATATNPKAEEEKPELAAEKVAALTLKPLLPTKGGGASRITVPVIASICGGVVLLLFMVSFGMAMKPGIPTTEMASNHCRHVVILVVYITFQCLYATVISMSVFMLILIAINSETVSNLKEYNHHTSLRNTVMKLEVDKMHHHLSIELKRQDNIANHSKSVCQQEMKHVADDMKKLHESLSSKAEDMLDKHNLMALFNLQAHQVMDKMKMELLDFRSKYQQFANHVLRTVSLDVKKIYNSIENNKWLTGARFLHGTVNNIRNLLNNNSVKDFMNWAGLNYELSQLTVDLTMPIPDMSELTSNLLPEKPLQKRTNARNTMPTNSPHHIDDFHVQDVWLYPTMPYVETKTPSRAEAGKNARRSNGRSTRNNLNLDDIINDDYHYDEQEDEHHEEQKPNISFFSNYYVLCFGAVILAVDIIRFLHIMIKSIGICRLMFFGYPVYVDCRERTGPSIISVASSSRSKVQKESCCHSFLSVVKIFFIKVLSTNFIPKAAATVIMCILLYVTNSATERYVNRPTIQRLGLYANMKHMIDLNIKITNQRIIAHAEQINVLEYPTQGSLMNSYIERHQHILNGHQNQSGYLVDAQTAVYCDYLRSLNVGSTCDDRSFEGSTSVHVTLHGCQFPNVAPQLYRRNRTDISDILDRQIDSFLMNVRQVAVDVCFVIFIFLSTIILKDLLGMSLWLYMKRSGIIKLRLVYETDAGPIPKETRE